MVLRPIDVDLFLECFDEYAFVAGYPGGRGNGNNWGTSRKWNRALRSRLCYLEKNAAMSQDLCVLENVGGDCLRSIL